MQFKSSPSLQSHTCGHGLQWSKADGQDKDTTTFRTFKHQLYHTSLGNILALLHPDAHFCHVVYGIGVNTQDYLEQALAACVVEGWCPICFGNHNDLDVRVNQGRRTEEFTEALDYGIVKGVIPYMDDFPRADIHELLSGNILHQIIKPVKDHLINWTQVLLEITYGEALVKYSSSIMLMVHTLLVWPLHHPLLAYVISRMVGTLSNGRATTHVD
ncbi:hypothetical protein C8Q72DRAFT_799231 [Fomitopsis betulina]|nr:hypothetical protein C8Q72DRAFT_799231 [Fomitopsis betulina]